MHLKRYRQILLAFTTALMVSSCAMNGAEKTPLKSLTNNDEIENVIDPKAVDNINKNLFQAGDMERMTLSFVATRILTTNPDIEIFNAREEQAKYGVDISKSKYWPTLDVKVSGGPENVYAITGSTTGTLRKEASIALKATVFDFGKREREVEQSQAAYEAAQLRAKDKADTILLSLTNAYLDVLETRDLVRITSRNIIEIEKFRNLVKVNQEEGNASIADLRKVEAKLENARASYVDLRADFEASRENFKKITDFYPYNLQALPKLSEYEQANFASEKFELSEKKYELNAVRKDIESLKRKLESIEASRLPVFKVAALADYKENIAGVNDPVTDLRVDFSVKYRIFDGGLKQAEQNRVQAQIREGRALLRKKQKNFEQDILNADNDQRATAKKNGLLAKRLEAANKVVELNTEQFKEGVLTVFELLDAQAQLLSANQDLINNRYQKYRVRYKQLQLADRLLTSLVIGQ